MVVLHGEGGYWDELVIAFAAFAVLWIAVKLARQKPADDADEDEESASEAATTEDETSRPVAPQ